VDVPPMLFLAIDGTGDPNTAPAYKAAVEALFAVAYGLKFHYKKGAPSFDYKVMPLEGLWWPPEGEDYSPERKDRLSWTMLIRQPDEVTGDRFEEVRRQVARKKELPALADLRLERLHEGRAAQIMHIGPFDDEGPTVEVLNAFIAAHGGTLHGKHHEIYLSDLTRTAPAKLKTILRHPVA
jgi:hypothetical protein